MASDFDNNSSAANEAADQEEKQEEKEAKASETNDEGLTEKVSVTINDDGREGESTIKEVDAITTKIVAETPDVDDEKKLSVSSEEAQAKQKECPEEESKQLGGLSVPAPPKQYGDLMKLYEICVQFKLAGDQTILANDSTKSQTTESILQLLVTEDMSNIKSPDVLYSLFVEYLHLLPPKVISEVLSVLIAIVKKSVFHLESARGLLIPCIDHLLPESAATKHPYGNNSSNTRLNSQQTTDTASSASSVSLTKHFLREWINLLIAHSCDVDELKSILRFSEHDPSLLNFIQQANLRQRNRPPAFFAFPGTKGSMMSLPPFQKWPIQLGWSFSTWFFLEPKACAQPYLYNFKTGKSGLGYSAHFTGNCLVLTSIRVKGKGVQHCVAYEFPSYKWIHCAITYHNKWRASEIKVYVNGQLSANIEMPWQVQTTEIYDKCFIGGSESITSNNRSGELNCFCGQMSAIYLFNEGLSPTQICAIHRLGPSYMGQFKYSNESHVNLPPQVCKALYEEKLASTLSCLFTPVAVDSGALCIQLAPFKSSTTVSAHNYFISAPHAALLGQTKAIITQPICSTLQSLGFSRSLLPLLDLFASRENPEACASLIGFLCDLLESSPHWFANEIVQNNGFVIVACALARNARLLLSERMLDIFLNLTRTLLTTSSTVGDSLLLKHLMDNILFNHTLWIYADTKLQIKLYNYLATEFLHGSTRHGSNRYTISNSASSVAGANNNSSSSSSTFIAYNPTSSVSTALSNQTYANQAPFDEQHQGGSRSGIYENPSTVVTDLLFGEIRRVSTVLQSLHALKYFYWMAEEKNINPKARNYRLRPNQEDLVTIRTLILQFSKELIVRANTIPLDEVQGILNYLSSCTHSENLLDVLDMLSSLLRELPTSMVSALDQKQGVKVLFTLIGSKSEKVRIEALKLLSLFLSQCSHKKKQDIMNPDNLFTLLCDRLRPYKPLSYAVYEALIDIMVESDLSPKPTTESSSLGRTDMSKERIENSVVVKVIATLLHEERSYHLASKTNHDTTSSSSSPDIRRVFINDLWNLIVNSKENRRTILQMSVWQHWLINLMDSTASGDSQLVRDQVLSIFRVLLYHAIRYEFGGWRVWIDTLAIIHTKVSYDEFCQQLNSTDSLSADEFNNIETREIESSRMVSSNDRKVVAVEEVQSSDKASGDDKSKGADQPVDSDDSQQQQPVVSSISERIPRESSGIQMAQQEDTAPATDTVDHSDTQQELSEKLSEIQLSTEGDDHTSKALDETTTDTETKADSAVDTVDIAPSRAYRRLSLSHQNGGEPKEVEVDAEPDTARTSDGGESPEGRIARQQSLTSIPLEESSSSSQDEEEEVTNCSASNNHELDELKHSDESGTSGQRHSSMNEEAPAAAPESSHPNNHQKAQASPAFRIPEFKWGGILIKLLNDLMFSIECDLYHWRCIAKCTNLDLPPFVPKSANSSAAPSHSASSSGTASLNARSTSSIISTAANAASNADTVHQIEGILQKAENQIYIINIVHFISQLADNIIIASGGLLPLLADATGGARNSSSADNHPLRPAATLCEGLTMPQANSLLYRLVNMVDVVIFAASHINLNELEADKNTTSGGILRQCLRLACTVTVKNCLVVRGLHQRSMGNEYLQMTAGDFPKDMFDSYQGCSLLSANGLFENSALSLNDSDLIANLEYSPHQTPNTSAMPSLLPFQSAPIKDPNKLLQTIDISRIQACIYHDFSTESRQSQFLALSSLYFISVLMVSKYRDIIEPKQQKVQQKPIVVAKQSTAGSAPATDSSSTTTSQSSGFQNGSSASSIVEANLLSFGKIQPNSSGTTTTSSTSSSSNLTDMLTNKLENTLDTVCPLLKSIMCDFCAFLSKTLIGSHGQDLVNKEADRTFRRQNTSPVELVMLLCSQEWQNTLQKNAGLAFIELINEGRVLSHGMKDHIVRVAMEAEFILSRLRADDVAKHEHFQLACSETQTARLHEELLINSLISSASRRDYVIYCKFSEMVQRERRRNYKLDIWEDDDRRRRRFVIDSWSDAQQTFYSAEEEDGGAGKGSGSVCGDDKLDTKRILELQQTIELGGIDDHCSPAGTNHLTSADDGEMQQPQGDSLKQQAADDDCEEEEFEEEEEEEEEEARNDSNSPDSELADKQHQQQHPHKMMAPGGKKSKGRSTPPNSSSNYLDASLADESKRGHNFYSGGSTTGSKSIDHELGVAAEAKRNQAAMSWDYDDCSSVNDFTGSVVFAAECSLIWSIYAIPGVFQLTAHELYFEPNQNISEAIDLLKRASASGNSHQQEQQDLDEISSLKSMKSNQESYQSGQFQNQDQITLRKLDLKVLRYCDFLACNGKILLSDMRAIFLRHYLLQPHALEIFLAQRSSVMFAFPDFDTVKLAVNYLPPVGVGIKYGIPQSRRASLMGPRQLFAASNMTQKWQRREIGNFQYLVFLNTIAGRTYQDLNQYPVFPWILTNYSSDELDLNLPTNFRDLSKPVGALNNKRRNEFIERYQSWDNPKVPAFHYGTHYSTAAFTLNWLCRLRGAPNSAYLALQDGKYEESSRLFLSIGDSWVSSLTGGQQNVKELIPEFFYLPEMFHSQLGLPEVEFPPWANNSAEHFVRTHRLALESELVSCQLHQWIDLIFGYKQRGPEAINAVNTFYYLTYQGNVNLNMIQDPSLRDAIEAQIKHFGQTPSQLTTEPHPPRFSALHVSPLIFSSAADEVNKVIKFPFNTSVVHISSCISNFIAPTSAAVASSSGDSSSGAVGGAGSNSNKPSSILTITSNNQYQIHKWMPNDQSGHPFTIDPQLDSTTSSSSQARRQLIDVDDLYSGISLKLGHHQKSGSTTNGQAPEEVQWPCAHYIVTLDGRYIIMGSFYDNSFRVFTTESGKLCQVIYGHRGPITCIARSDGNASGDFYVATGSQDCSLLLWTWNEKYAQVEGSGVSAVHNPLPKLTISGHQSSVLSVVICAELGLIVSGSKNLILVHATSSGENILEIDVVMPQMLDKATLEGRFSSAPQVPLQRPQVKDKQKTILEASMLGELSSSSSSPQGAGKSTAKESSPRSHSPAVSSTTNGSERFSHLKDLCINDDYYITNLQLARELAFIVCVALPPPKSRKSKSSTHSRDGGESRTTTTTTRSSAPLLMTFNLKGFLMDCTTIGQTVNGPRLGDVCVLQTTRDGEHLVLNDSPTSLKIYRTFDLQPVYAYNTSDVGPASVGASLTVTEDQNRIKSLTLIDHKYILAGLENGKIIVYNADFKNLH